MRFRAAMRQGRSFLTPCAAWSRMSGLRGDAAIGFAAPMDMAIPRRRPDALREGASQGAVPRHGTTAASRFRQPDQGAFFAEEAEGAPRSRLSVRCGAEKGQGQ